MHFRFALLTVLAAAAIGGSAQEPQRPGGPGGPGGVPPFAGRLLFTALDTDHDNSLSAAEIGAASSGLKQLDRNGDGTVTADELPPMPGGRGPGGRGRGGSGIGGEAPAEPPTPDELAATLMAFDKNKDGRLEKSEAPDRLQGLFARLDENADGVLTADEIKKGAAAQPLQTPTRGRGEGRQGEGRGGPPRRDAFYSALDKNGDGILSSDEITGATTALKAIDANGDGAITMEEVFPPGPGRGRL
jgi:Ca2+-binding EF-hand superfamily protein